MSGRRESNPVYTVPNRAYYHHTPPRICSQIIQKSVIITSMTSGFTLSLIILAVLAASLWYIVKAEGGYEQIPALIDRVGIPIDVSRFFPEQPKKATPTPAPASNVPPQYQSGNSRFSQGTCKTAANCVPAGCSGEVCSNDANVASTCEYSPSFPNAQGYSCTCLPQGVCGWDNKKAIYD